MSTTAALLRIGYRPFMASQPAQLAGLVVIAGREHMLADEVLKRLVESALPDESLRPLNVDTLDALETDDFGVLAEKLGALPFLAQRRIVTVRNVIELRNDDRIKLRDAIPELGEQAVLIIDDSGEARPQRGKAPKDKVNSADFASASPSALLVDCTLDEDERERYIEDYAKTIGVSVDAGARRYLAAFESVYEIRNALDRLALMSTKISKAAAEEYVKPPGDPKLWDLGNAVGRGDLHAALTLAHRWCRGQKTRPDR